MNNLSILLLEFLCHITVQPEGDHDPEDTADIQINSWQTLIRDLDHNETEAIKGAAQLKLNSLFNIATPTTEQEQLVGILGAFIND
ncbi:MAG: hypothetical protein AB2689_09370 [Candidatus Thiodiazotropha taylori]